MFGYVRPYKTMMLVGEYEEYKAVYCTLCRTLGKRYNVFTRMALNYDLTFYTLLCLDLTKTCPKVRKGRCVVNPMKRCNYISEENQAYHKGAALTVLMTYHKILDNIKDESFFKSLSSRMLMPFIKGSAKKAAKDYPSFDLALKEMTKRQNEIEKSENPCIDECCEPTANALSKIFSEIDEEQKLVLSQIGYFLGRWIYLMDAADDLQKDFKDKAFNPLINYFELKGEIIEEEKLKEAEEKANEMLNNNAAMLSSSVNLLSSFRYGGITENILKLGLAQIQKEILFLHVRDKKRRKSEKF